jgi:hypothetical protein
MKPPESFVPLAAPVPPAPREFRLAVINGHDHANGNGQANGNGHANGDSPARNNGFQSLETQRPAGFTSANGAQKKIGEPRVSVQRDGDRVTHLRIQCSCGQTLDIACVYDAPPPPA